jgi:hypothetical protein
MTSQLVAIGQQDIHLTNDPSFSFFRSAYKRHTNFAQVVETQLIQMTPIANGISTVCFEKKGDLLSYVYLSDDSPYTDWSQIISKVELLIGGQVVDEQDSTFTEFIAVDTFASNVSKSSNGPHGGNGVNSKFYPLRFWFCENWHSALPLISLQYHDVEIRITWGSSPNTNIRCYANFIYLDKDERKKIIKQPATDFLITQVQKNIASNDKIQELTFNHPVKYLSSKNGNLTSTSKLKFQINGADIDDFKQGSPHFTEIPFYYHTPCVTSPDTFLYPFCLNTAQFQPSGTLNFSRLDSARIVNETQNVDTDIYAVSYNILRIQNGMGGVLYAN